MNYEDLLNKIERLLTDDERVEGLREIRRFLDPGMSRRTFYRRHRRELEPYLLERRDYWKQNKPRYFTFRRLLMVYAIRRRMI